MATTIAILNGKGGVGKTTTAINLGTALWLLGKKVMMVDADPQCNLTLAMDRTAYGMESGTLYEWMLDENYDQEGHEIPTYTKYEGLDYIPASMKMESLNQWLVNQTKREDYLTDRISILKDYYDYIIIDCAPAIDSMLNTNVLVAADGIIIPTRTDLFGIQSQGLMQDRIQDIRKKFRKNLPILGYLLTQWEKTKVDKNISEYFREKEDVPLYDTPIRKCVKCRECINEQMSLYELDSSCTAAQDYMSLAMSVAGISRLPKKSTPAEWGRVASKAFESFIKNQQA